MTQTHLTWGDNPSLFGGWALEGMNIWRVLLPVRGIHTTLSWAEVADSYEKPRPVDGYLSWEDLVDLSNVKTSRYPSYDAPVTPNDEVADQFRDSLGPLTTGQLWHADYGHATLDQLLSLWQRHHNLGRWQCGNIGLAAPAIATRLLLVAPVPWVTYWLRLA